jgi:phosphoribosylanthranilate isomerase
VTRAKICGITRLEDAELAAELGAWAIGFILWPGSKRACDPAMAAAIARRVRRNVQLVGVFVNASLDDIAHAADAIGLTHLQLHGSEGPSFCAAAAARTGCRVIKAARIRSAADVRDIERFRLVDLHLLDSYVEGRPGGTGETWDWSLLAARRTKVPALLSGGLTPENVGAAVARVKPWGVDVASGVEASPGVKDPDRVRAFVEAVGGAREHAASATDAPAATAAAEAPGATAGADTGASAADAA